MQTCEKRARDTKRQEELLVLKELPQMSFSGHTREADKVSFVHFYRSPSRATRNGRSRSAATLLRALRTRREGVAITRRTTVPRWQTTGVARSACRIATPKTVSWITHRNLQIHHPRSFLTMRDEFSSQHNATRPSLLRPLL